VIIRCIVAASNAGGEPDLFFVKVKCSLAQYENGDHYKAASEAAEENGYEPSLAFDENDPGGRAMLPLFVWESASVVKA